MNLKRRKFIIPAAALIFIISGLFSISLLHNLQKGPDLQGKWEDIKLGDSIEFSEDGKLIIDNGLVLLGTYERISNDSIRVKLEGVAGSGFTELWGNTWKYRFQDDLLYLTYEPFTLIYKRVIGSQLPEMK